MSDYSRISIAVRRHLDAAKAQRETAEIAEAKLDAVINQRDELQRQLAEVTRERDRLREALAFADARINKMVEDQKGPQ